MAALKGTDGGFTAESIQKRLPQILDSVLKSNPGFSPKTVADLQVLLVLVWFVLDLCRHAWLRG
jgi:hypothetical protein